MLARRVLFAVLVLLASLRAHADAGGLTTPPFDPAAKYRAVHIDTLDPARQPVFEKARREWLVALAAKHTSDGRGFFLERDGHTLLTLRSFASFTELDALVAFRRSVAERTGEEAAKRYDEGDVALVPPHSSEIWSRAEHLDYRAAGDTLSEYTAGHMQMVVENIVGDEYHAAWKEIHAALETAHYPLSRVTFFSSYGSGKTITLWLAKDRQAFRAAGTPEAAVARTLGKGNAAALFRRYRKGSALSTTHEVVARPELASPEATPAVAAAPLTQSFDQTLASHLQAIAQRDLPAILATVADELTLILPSGKLLQGKPAYADFHREWFGERTWSMQFRELRRVETGDLAMVLFQTDYRDKDKSGAPIHTQGFLAMLFRNVAGRWLLVHDQNTRIPPA